MLNFARLPLKQASFSRARIASALSTPAFLARTPAAPFRDGTSPWHTGMETRRSFSTKSASSPSPMPPGTTVVRVILINTETKTEVATDVELKGNAGTHELAKALLGKHREVLGDIAPRNLSFYHEKRADGTFDETERCDWTGRLTESERPIFAVFPQRKKEEKVDRIILIIYIIQKPILQI